MADKYIPKADRVLIKPSPIDKTISGFIIDEKEQEQKYEGQVVSVGSGIPLHNVQITISGDNPTSEVLKELKEVVQLLKDGRPMWVRPGDYVLYGKYSGTKIKIHGVEHIMIREADIFCLIEKD